MLNCDDYQDLVPRSKLLEEQKYKSELIWCYIVNEFMHGKYLSVLCIWMLYLMCESLFSVIDHYGWEKNRP